jgi:hypothetical protein
MINIIRDYKKDDADLSLKKIFLFYLNYHSESIKTVFLFELIIYLLLLMILMSKQTEYNFYFYFQSMLIH